MATLDEVLRHHREVMRLVEAVAKKPWARSLERLEAAQQFAASLGDALREAFKSGRESLK